MTFGEWWTKLNGFKLHLGMTAVGIVVGIATLLLVINLFEEEKRVDVQEVQIAPSTVVAPGGTLIWSARVCSTQQHTISFTIGLETATEPVVHSPLPGGAFSQAFPEKCGTTKLRSMIIPDIPKGQWVLKVTAIGSGLSFDTGESIPFTVEDAGGEQD